MQRLKNLLETAVNQTKFDLGQVEHRSNGTRSSHAQRPDEVIEPDQFRRIVNANRWNDEFISAQSARLVVPGEIHSQLVTFLHDLLGEYIDPETASVGHAFPINGSLSRGSHSSDVNWLSRSAYVSQVEDIALALVRGSAILGVDRVSDLVSGWLLGKPVEYRSSTLIGGLFIDEPLVPLDGVQLSPLPRTSVELPGNLPRSSSLSRDDYIARTLASIRTLAKPAFFHPVNLWGANSVKIASSSKFGFPQLCKALSLVENSSIEPGFFWIDYLELSAFCLSTRLRIWSIPNMGFNSSLPFETTYAYDFESDKETVILPEESVSNIDHKELQRVLEAVAGVNSRELDLAIERWSRSKRSSANLEDSFIDLRIALETLFLKDFTGEYSQEMRFRLALFGAWYLGADFQERVTIRKTLRDAYDRASGVIHGGGLEFNDSNRVLLSRAQDLCRQGILKLISEGMPSSEDWSNLILGSDLESCEKP